MNARTVTQPIMTAWLGCLAVACAWAQETLPDVCWDGRFCPPGIDQTTGMIALEGDNLYAAWYRVGLQP